MSAVNFNKSSFDSLLGKGILGGLGTSTQISPEEAALIGLLAGPGGEILGKAVEGVVNAVTADPKGAAKLLREATQLAVPLIQEGNKLGSVDDGVATVTETAKTIRKERRNGYSKTTKTTTETRERTIDSVQQQKKLEQDLATVQQLVDGLEDGRIQIGDATVTFDQIQGLVKSLIELLAKGNPQEEPIDIGGSDETASGNEDKGNDKTSFSSSV